MGGLLTAILGAAGQTGSNLQEAKTANQLERERQTQTQARLKQQGIEAQTSVAPKFVGSYRAADGKTYNKMYDPVSGRVTDVLAQGPGELSGIQQKIQDAEKVLGPLSEDQKAILAGVLPKQSSAAEKIIAPPGGAPYGKFKPGKGIVIPGSPDWTPEDQKELDAATKSYQEGKGDKTQGKVSPIIAAQIGPQPDASKFPKGKDDPAYKSALKKWGIDAETITNRMAQQRGIGYNYSRPGGYVDPATGNLVTATAGTAIAKGYVPAAPGFQAMSKQAQFSEMTNASGNLRHAIEALQPEDAFTPEQTVQLKLAAQAPDGPTFHAIVTQLASQSLNDRQQDYLIWLGQMGERILSLRNVAGMGQGAQDLRAAIQATLPTITSGTKQFALKRLDAVDNQINLLQRGIPKINLPGGDGTPPPGSKIIKWEDVK